jgi:hypothetical protein
MRSRSRVAGACLALCLFAPLPLLAQSPARDRTWFATVYGGQWFSESAPNPGQTLGTQDAGFQDSYFVSALLSRVLMRELKTELPLVGPLIDDSSIELEGQIGHHFGLQDHAEVTLALLWRSRDFVMPLTNGRLNLAVGEGLSYALSRPAYEGVSHGQEPRKFLNYLTLEAEFSHPSLPGVSVVPRVHHRSGIYGVIAPRGSGSNFIGIGLRIALQ